MFLHENALNTKAFPSLGQIQSEVVGWTAGLLHGPETAAGFLTSGGTESIQCAVLAARERGRIERGITEPEIVVAESAHAAFHKSAHLFGMRIVDDARARRLDGRRRRRWPTPSDPNTVLVVGSAPQYPQGVIDPIPEIAALAATVDANCHVDACMGGFVLPFAELLGRPVPPWDFRVDGVHSISADVHKLGYAPKGVSVILHRTKQLRALPDVRVRRLARRVLRLAEPPGHPLGPADGRGVGGDAAPRRRGLRRADPARRSTPPTGCGPGIAAVDGLRVLGDGELHLVAMAADPTDGTPRRRVRPRGRPARPGAGSTTARGRPTRCTRRSATPTSA